jgi:hypothetical protein
MLVARIFSRRWKYIQVGASFLQNISPVKPPQYLQCVNEAYLFERTVSHDEKSLEVISVKSPWLGHVTPDI